jgi:hypothetical protein
MASWRVLAFALVIAGAASVAHAQYFDGLIGDGARHASPTPPVPRGAPREAVDAVRYELSDPASAEFRDVQAKEVAQVKRGPPWEHIDGPVAIVCGQYTSQDSKGGAYAWFFVAMKQDQALWITVDQPGEVDGEGYMSCKASGLIKPAGHG